MPFKFLRGVYKTRFKTEIERETLVKHPNIPKLIKFGRKLEELELTPQHPRDRGGGSYGNISFRDTSFRDGKTFVITAALSHLGKLEEHNFVRVLKCDLDKKEVHIEGLHDPSGEVMVHHEIYEKRPDVKAVVHIHDPVLEKIINEASKDEEFQKAVPLVFTKEHKKEGTPELAKEVGKVLTEKKNGKYPDLIYMKNHGPLFLGKSLDEAMAKALQVHKHAVAYYMGLWGEKREPPLEFFGPEVKLDDGKIARIGPLTRDDISSLQKFFENLDEETIRLRFGSVKDKYSRSSFHKTFRLLPEEYSFVVKVRDPKTDKEEIAGEARLIFDFKNKRAEFGVVVGEKWRRKKFASMLLEHCKKIAKMKGMERIEDYIDIRNKPIIEFAKKHGFELELKKGLFTVPHYHAVLDLTREKGELRINPT